MIEESDKYWCFVCEDFVLPEWSDSEGDYLCPSCGSLITLDEVDVFC